MSKWPHLTKSRLTLSVSRSSEVELTVADRSLTACQTVKDVLKNVPPPPPLGFRYWMRRKVWPLVT